MRDLPEVVEIKKRALEFAPKTKGKTRGNFGFAVGRECSDDWKAINVTSCYDIFI